MGRRSASIGLMTYAVLAALVVLAGLPPVVVLVCAAPLVLVVPGYSALLAVDLPFQDEAPGRRLVLAVALSMASVVLGGLVLNALFSLTAAAWATWLASLTVACAAVALVRSTGSVVAPRRAALRRTSRELVPQWRHVLAATVVALATGGAILVTKINGRATYDKSLTQLSVLPVGGSGDRVLRLTVTNASSHVAHLTLRVAYGKRRSAETSRLTIRPSRSWSRLESAPAAAVMTATLSRPGARGPLSEVTWSSSR